MTASVDTATLNDVMTKSQSSELLESTDTGAYPRSRRRRNVREAIIAEDDNERNPSKAKSSSLSSSYLGELVKIIIIQAIIR